MNFNEKILFRIGPGLLFALIFVAVQFIVSFISMMVISVFTVLQSGGEAAVDFTALTQQVSAATLENSNLISMISNVITLLILWAVFAVSRRRYIQQVHLFRAPIKSLWPIPLFAAAMTLVVTSAMALLPISESALEGYEQLSGTLQEGDPIIGFISVVLIAPIAEEVVFRGLVFTRFRSGMPLVIALILESVIFGLLHGTAIWIVYAFALGLIMTLVFEAYGTILASIIFHVFFNLFGTYVTPYIGFASAWYPLVGGFVIAAACAAYMVIWRNKRRVIDSE